MPGWKQGMFGLPAVGYGVSRTTADVCLLGAKTMAESRLSLGLWRLPPVSVRYQCTLHQSPPLRGDTSRLGNAALLVSSGCEREVKEGAIGDCLTFEEGMHAYDLFCHRNKQSRVLTLLSSSFTKSPRDTPFLKTREVEHNLTSRWIQTRPARRCCPRLRSSLNRWNCLTRFNTFRIKTKLSIRAARKQCQLPTRPARLPPRCPARPV